jgi:hypothetical protein
MTVKKCVPAGYDRKAELITKQRGTKKMKEEEMDKKAGIEEDI